MAVSLMHYVCMEFKPFYKNNRDAEAHRLGELEEARGEMLRVFKSDGQCVAVFEWGAISLPQDLCDELREMVGWEIAILRFESKYHVRRLDGA